MIVTENKHGDHTLAVGDFNVDFDHGCSLASSLTDFLWNTIFVVIDVSYCE